MGGETIEREEAEKAAKLEEVAAIKAMAENKEQEKRNLLNERARQSWNECHLFPCSRNPWVREEDCNRSVLHINAVIGEGDRNHSVLHINDYSNQYERKDYDKMVALAWKTVEKVQERHQQLRKLPPR
jgi:endonuclease IV